MKKGLISILIVLITAILIFTGTNLIAKAYLADQKPADIASLPSNSELLTVNTTRIGSDDAFETAVAVTQIIYPATEEENTPGAVILVNINNLPELLVAANRIQHFPVNAPLLYVEQSNLPQITRNELLRLNPEGVPADGNVQVYLVGTIDASVNDAVNQLGFKTRVFTAPDPIQLAEVVDNWTSTQHGDHPNEVAIANIEHPEMAIPAAYWNAHMGQGFAYVTSEGVPEATKEILKRRANGAWIYVFGDESIVPEHVVRELAQYGQVTRMPRNDPSAISAYFSGFKDIGADWGAWFWQKARDFGWGISEAGHNAVFVNLDGPAGWQNAVTATTLSHMGKHAPVLILDGDGVPDSVRNYLMVLKPYPTDAQQQLLNHGWIIGGEETISWQTQVELDTLLEAYPFEE
jgi:hypothetical protein